MQKGHKNHIQLCCYLCETDDLLTDKYIYEIPAKLGRMWLAIMSICYSKNFLVYYKHLHNIARFFYYIINTLY